MHADDGLHGPERPAEVAHVRVELDAHRARRVHLRVGRHVRLRDVAQARGLADLVVERDQRIAEAEHADDDHAELLQQREVRAPLLGEARIGRSGGRRHLRNSFAHAHLRKLICVNFGRWRRRGTPAPRPRRRTCRPPNCRRTAPRSHRRRTGRRSARRPAPCAVGVAQARAVGPGRDLGGHIGVTGRPAVFRTCGTAPATAPSTPVCRRLPTAWPGPSRRRRGCT